MTGCAACRELAARAEADGKAGYVRCGACQERGVADTRFVCDVLDEIKRSAYAAADRGVRVVMLPEAQRGLTGISDRKVCRFCRNESGPTQLTEYTMHVVNKDFRSRFYRHEMTETFYACQAKSCRDSASRQCESAQRAYEARQMEWRDGVLSRATGGSGGAVGGCGDGSFVTTINPEFAKQLASGGVTLTTGANPGGAGSAPGTVSHWRKPTTISITTKRGSFVLRPEKAEVDGDWPIETALNLDLKLTGMRVDDSVIRELSQIHAGSEVISVDAGDMFHGDACLTEQTLNGGGNEGAWIASLTFRKIHRVKASEYQTLGFRQVTVTPAQYDTKQQPMRTVSVSLSGGDKAPAAKNDRVWRFQPMTRPDGFSQSQIDAAKAVLLSVGTKKVGK